MRSLSLILVWIHFSCTAPDKPPVLEGRWKLVRIAGEGADAEEDAFFTGQLQKGGYTQILEFRGDSLINFYRRGNEPPLIRRSRYRRSEDGHKLFDQNGTTDTIRVRTLTTDSLILDLPLSTHAYVRE